MLHLLHSLIASSSLLAICAAEAGNGDFAFDGGVVALLSTCDCSSAFTRAVDGADDFGVAHFEVAAAIGGGLGGAGVI